MKNDYKITVVIPNYNKASFLTQCIESVVNQTYPVEKIIVVDDCSTDNSIEVLNSLEKKYSNLTHIEQKVNGRVSHARNTGLAAVRTPYVTFLDSDDIYLSPQKLENEMKLIRDCKEKEHKDVITYSYISLISQDGDSITPLRYADKYYLQGYIYSDVLTSKYFFTIMRDFCMRADSVRGVGGYNENNSLYEDLELIIKLAKNFEFRFTGELGTGYRQMNNGLSSRPKVEHEEKKQQIFEAFLSEEPKELQLKYRVLRKKNLLFNTLFRKKRAWVARARRMLNR